MNKKEYIIPQTECLETRLELNITTSANAVGSGSDLSTPVDLGGTWEGLF